jgi:MFS family permease
MGRLNSTTKHDPFLALRSQNYRNLAIARLILLTVFQMQTVTVGWELYERTRDPLVLGGVGLIQILPIMAVTVLAGHFADHSHRKQIILLCGGLMAVSALGLTLVSFYQASIWLVYGCLFFSGLARGFHKPATDALLWQYIPTSAYSNAATWNSTVFQFASVFGPALGGVLIATLQGAVAVYAIVTLATLVYMALIARLPNQASRLKGERLSLRSLAAGFTFLRQHPVILAAISLDLFAVLLGGAVTLLPVYALDNISVVIRHTLAQLWTPDHLRGRVSAINSVFISMSNELGGFESGLVAALFSPVISVVSGGIGTILVVLIIASLCPDIRQLRELTRSPVEG